MKVSLKIRSLVALSIGITTLLGARPASAQLYMDLTGGSPVSDARDFSLGYSFTVSSAKSVNSLGVFDVGGDGLATSYPVAIWNQTTPATPLLSATVPAGVAGTSVASTAGNGVWRMITTSLISLTPGNTYVISMFRPGSTTDQWDFGTPAPASGINYVTGLETQGSSLVMPTAATGNNKHFGPTFAFTGAPAVGPEPGSLALLTLGIFGLLARRRK